MLDERLTNIILNLYVIVSNDIFLNVIVIFALNKYGCTHDYVTGRTV